MIDVVGSDTQQSPEQAYLAVRTLCGLLRLRGFLWLALKLLPVQPVISVSVSGGPGDTWAEGVSVVPHLEVPHSLESGLTALTTYKGPHSVWIEDWEIRALARPELELRDSTQILLAADHCQSVPANEACSVIPLLLLQASFIPDVIAAAAEDLLKTKGLLEVTEHMTIAFKLSLRNYQAVSSLCLLAMWIEEAKKKQWLHKAGKSPQTSPRLPQTEADLHMFCTNNFAMASSPMKELHVLAYHDIIRTLLQVESLGEDNKRSNQSLCRNLSSFMWHIGLLQVQYNWELLFHTKSMGTVQHLLVTSSYSRKKPLCYVLWFVIMDELYHTYLPIQTLFGRKWTLLKTRKKLWYSCS